MNYRELAGLAHHHEWAANIKKATDAKNEILLAARQAVLDSIPGVRVGDFVVDQTDPKVTEYAGNDGLVLRVAHHWGDSIQLTDGRFGASFYLGRDGHLSMSGGLNPGIDARLFVATDERRRGSVWFFSEDYAIGHNGYDCEAEFRVWKLVRQ